MELQYYWNVLDKTRNIMIETHKQNIAIQPETETICGIAMANIIRSGYPFSIVDHSPKGEEKKKGILDSFIEEIPTEDKFDLFETEEDIFEKDEFGYKGVTIDIKNESGTLFSCPDDVMRRILRDSYRKLILHEEDAVEKEELIEEDEFNIDIDFLKKQEEEKRREEEERLRAEEEARLKAEQEAAAHKEELVFDVNIQPEFEYLPQFPEDDPDSKDYSTFLCNEHRVVFTGAANASPITFMVYPLGCSEEDTVISDVFVVASVDGSIRAGISRGATSAVTMEFDNHKFMVRGAFRQGAFVSQINSMRADEPIEVSVIPHVPTERKASTYIRVPLSDGVIYIFPAIMRDNNGITGLAESALAVQAQNNVKVLCPTSDGRFVINQDTLLECYWMGDTFYFDFQGNN